MAIPATQIFGQILCGRRRAAQPLSQSLRGMLAIAIFASQIGMAGWVVPAETGHSRAAGRTASLTVSFKTAKTPRKCCCAHRSGRCACGCCGSATKVVSAPKPARACCQKKSSLALAASGQPVDVCGRRKDQGEKSTSVTAEHNAAAEKSSTPVVSCACGSHPTGVLVVSFEPKLLMRPLPGQVLELTCGLIAVEQSSLPHIALKPLVPPPRCSG